MKGILKMFKEKSKIYLNSTMKITRKVGKNALRLMQKVSMLEIGTGICLKKENKD